LNKKVLAIAIAAVMILGLFTALTPAVKAQKDQTGCELYNPNAAIPYSATPGQNTDPFCVYLHPGAGDSYKTGWSHTLNTLWGTQELAHVPGTPNTNAQTRQVFDKYLDYAILASASDSIGDLQFDFTIPVNTTAINVRYIDIFVPPEFQWNPDLTREEAIWTDITNDYQYITTSKRSAYDPIAPNWVRVRIGQDQWFGGKMNITAGTYHVRLFDLRAPEVAGLYHFKIVASTAAMGAASIGVGNYPFIIVKNELNPAWVEVTVRTHACDAPPYVSGSVLAEGTTPEGRAVSAVGYFSRWDYLANNTTPGEKGALYRVYLFGLAEGTYTLKAEASGFNPTVTDRFPVYAGQSYHQFIVIFDSPDVHVTIWSKHGTGAIPWHNLWQLPYGTNDPMADANNADPRRDMLLELYDADSNLIGFWASDWNTGGPTSDPLYTGGGAKFFAGANKLIGWHDDGACIPTATDYHAWLVDNWDVLYNPRGYPSTHWDGHAPWDTADYIAGWPNGQYTVEAYVTGYIMAESDDYQRTFSLVGSNYQLQFDLRRTNWIEVSMHMPTTLVLSADTTVTLTAEDAAGNERAAVAFIASPANSTNHILDGDDVSGGAYHGGIVIEGFNAIFPNTQALSGARDINKKDYGLNPTASTHSMGQVTLAGNPYTIKLFMADMGLPWARVNGTGWYNIVGDAVTTVALCNSPTPLSFKIVPAWLWISLRSVDFEVPAHSRPWTFPGSEIWVDFINEAGESQDILDPTLYGLIQDAGTTNASLGWPIVGALAGSYGVTPFDVDNLNAAGRHEHLGVYYYGSDYCAYADHFEYALPLDYPLAGYYRSTRLPAGVYTYNAYTHGYIQRRSFAVQVPFSGGANIEADLIQGGQIRVLMDFLHEAVATNFSGFVRVEVFNAAEELVGASIYGQAEPNNFTQVGMGGGYLGYQGWADHMVVPGPAQAADFGQYNETSPEDVNTFPSSTAFANGQRAFTSHNFYSSTMDRPIPNATWAGWPATNPCDANRLVMTNGQLQYFDVYGFYWYHGDAARTWAGGWPTNNGWNTADGGMGPNWWVGDNWDYGLKGSVDIPGWEGSGGGLYTVKVWAFDPRGPNNAYEHTGWTDDWRMYAMGWPLENVEVPWGGSVELFMHMNNMAKLSGTIRWFDMFNNLRPLPWAQISATNPDTVAYSTGLGSVGSGTSDPSGAFVMWLPAGTHDVSVSTSEAPQVWAPGGNDAYTIVVSDGWVSNNDSQLSASGTPIPELPAFLVPLSLFAALAASAWLLRKRSINVPVLMK